MLTYEWMIYITGFCHVTKQLWFLFLFFKKRELGDVCVLSPDTFLEICSTAGAPETKTVCHQYVSQYVSHILEWLDRENSFHLHLSFGALNCTFDHSHPV